MKKKVFFQGMQHELSEKESIDSDEVMTSEDEFQVDDLVIDQYNKRLSERVSKVSVDE